MAYELYNIPMHHTQHGRGHAQSTWEEHPDRIPKPELIEPVHEAMRSSHYSKRAEQACSHWILQFIPHHGVRHSVEMGVAEINTFFTHRNEEFYTDPYNTTE